MREIKNPAAHHSSVITGRFRAERGVLMTAEVLVSPVEIGVVHFAERNAAIDADPLRRHVHDKWSMNAFRSKRICGLYVIRLIRTQPLVVNVERKNKRFAVFRHPAGSG